MGSYGIFWNDSGMFCRLPQVPQGRGSGLWAKARQVLPVRLLSWFSERLLTIILRWCLTLLPACSYSVWALWFPWHSFGVCTLAQIRFFWAKQCATWKWLYSNATSEMQKRCFIPRAAYFSKFCASSCGLHQSQWSQYTNTHSLTHSLTHTNAIICNHIAQQQFSASCSDSFGVWSWGVLGFTCNLAWTSRKSFDLMISLLGNASHCRSFTESHEGIR